MKKASSKQLLGLYDLEGDLGPLAERILSDVALAANPAQKKFRHGKARPMDLGVVILGFEWFLQHILLSKS